MQDSLSVFTDAYIEAALGSSTDDNDQPLDQVDVALSEECAAQMRGDCQAFFIANESLLDPENYTGKSYNSIVIAGHDFWLTRCGHGAGFWGGDWKEPAALKLTDAAHAFGNIDLYVGDDGLIYA